jgi:glutamate racemase
VSDSPLLEPRAPVGVFDSGVGGLSVLREIRRELPAEELDYVADSRYAPYGDHSAEYVLERSEKMTDFLLGRGAKAVVIACNTASASAVDALRARYPVPIVAMEPAVKPAVTQTRSGVVGVLATAHTLSTAKFAHLVATHAGKVRVLPQPCPGLADRVEAGDLSGTATRALLERYLTPLIEAGADTLVIGCTHYAFLEDLVREVAGPGVGVIDSAVPVARQLRRRLDELDLLAPEPGSPGPPRIWTTGWPSDVARVVARMWGAELEVRAFPS